MTEIKAHVIDIFNQRIFPAEVYIKAGIIDKIIELEQADNIQNYILPGFVDAHIHIESSMITPTFFSQEVMRHGTVATVSDPHEIANVCGLPGIEFMISNAQKSPLKIAFGAPSCVPATPFENAGAQIDADDVKQLLESDDIYYLAEVMNFPGVMNNDESLLQMIHHAQVAEKPVDGHAPQLRMPQILDYFSKGITTDHECVTIEEAQEKLIIGCKILIRNGSAAKNYKALSPLIQNHSENLMFCSDDKHPDELVEGHINLLVKKALEEGHNLFDVLRVACVNPVEHYRLPVGLLRVGDAADFIIIDDLENFEVIETWIDGQAVYSDEVVHYNPETVENINNFQLTRHISVEDIQLASVSNNGFIDCRIIGAIDGQLITENLTHRLELQGGFVQNDVDNDVLKCVVVNRYKDSKPAVAFIKNFGMKKGAVVSTVAHDSHNIIAVGVDDESIVTSINAIIDLQGGIGYVDEAIQKFIPLEIAGLMTQKDAHAVAEEYIELNQIVKSSACTLTAPFMTLSFMALPVIPHLKITNQGLFDVNLFSFV